MTKCNFCASDRLYLYGYQGLNLVYCCRSCGNRFVETIEKIKEKRIKVISKCQKIQ